MNSDNCLFLAFPRREKTGKRNETPSTSHLLCYAYAQVDCRSCWFVVPCFYIQKREPVRKDREIDLTLTRGSLGAATRQAEEEAHAGHGRSGLPQRITHERRATRRTRQALQCCTARTEPQTAELRMGTRALQCRDQARPPSGRGRARQHAAAAPANHSRLGLGQVGSGSGTGVTSSDGSPGRPLPVRR